MTFAGTILVIASPNMAPMAAFKDRAKAAPTKTTQGDLLCAESIIVDNWVLSPSSAMKIRPKVLSNNDQSNFSARSLRLGVLRKEAPVGADHTGGEGGI